MIGKMISRILSVTAISIAAAGAAEYERERYDVIVERSPFGEVLKATDTEEDPNIIWTEKQIKELEKKIRLCFLLKAENGEVRAGFQNVKAQKGEPKSVMLLVGESFQGMQLKSIDMEHSNATLSIGGKPVTFELKGDPSPAKTPTAKVAVANSGIGGLRKKTTEPQTRPELQLSPEEREAERQRIREKLRRFQNEVQPPQPISLTPDRGKQLAEEGVLPPREA